MASKTKVKTGTTGLGLCWAQAGEWKVTAHADGGYSRMRRIGKFWTLLPAGVQMPDGVERSLCATLKVACKR